MNLNQLWAGNDYAYYEMKGRGEYYRPNASRVRIIRAFQKKEWGNQRLSGYAEVRFLTDEGEPQLDYKNEPKIATVRARDIAMHWDEYSDERAHREEERERLQREREEQQAADNAKRTALLDAIVERFQISRDLVTSIDDYTVRFNRAGLERELGVNV